MRKKKERKKVFQAEKKRKEEGRRRKKKIMRKYSFSVMTWNRREKKEILILENGNGKKENILRKRFCQLNRT